MRAWSAARRGGLRRSRMRSGGAGHHPACPSRGRVRRSHRAAQARSCSPSSSCSLRPVAGRARWARRRSSSSRRRCSRWPPRERSWPRIPLQASRPASSAGSTRPSSRRPPPRPRLHSRAPAPSPPSSPSCARSRALAAKVGADLKRLGKRLRGRAASARQDARQGRASERAHRRAARMSLKSVLAVALGIMSAIGGFVDIGDLVFNTQAGATFGFQLLWVVVVGVVGIIVYSEMCGRVSAVSERPVFDLVRERAGFGSALATLIASEIVNLMTCAAEVGGVAICFQLLSGLPYRLLIPLAVLAARRDLLGAALPVARAGLRLSRPRPARLRGRGDQAPPRLGPGRARLRAGLALRRQPARSTCTSSSGCSARR